MSTKTLRGRHQDKNSTLQVVVFALLGILLFYPPFFRGLFFEKEILLTHTFSFGLFILYTGLKLKNKEKLTLDSPFGYIGLMLIIAYILPIVFFQWANLRDAMGLVLRHMNFFVVYLMVKDYGREDKYKNILLNIILASGLVVGVVGILAIAGYVSYADAVLGNRIASTFQYPNTLAAFMMTLFFIATGYQNQEEKLWRKTIYGAIGFIMLFTFIFTYSRAAWMLFPVFALFYLIVIPGRQKITTIFYYIAVSIPNLLLLQPFMNYTEGDEETKIRVLMVVAIGIGLFTAIYIGLQLIISKLQEKYFKLIYGFLGIMLAAAIGFTFLAINTIEPLVFDNMNVTENRVNQIQRTIKDIDAETEYVLKLQLESTNTEEDEWPWRVRIHSSNEAGNRPLLEQRVGELKESGIVEIPFTTVEDTEDLIIYFRNQHPETKVTFYEAVLYDHEGNLVKDIKLSYKYIPEQLISRFNSIDLNESSSSTRIAFYRDGMTMFKNHAIVGAGGGAWNELYPMYQSEPYFSTEAHNYFIQTMVETGVIGILIVAALLLLLLIALLQHIKKKDAMNITLIVAVLSLMGHSFLDFNFSYLSMPIILWGMIGLINTEGLQEVVKIKGKLKHIQAPAIMPLILTVIIFVTTISFYSGYTTGEKAVEALSTDGPDRSIELFKTAAKRDPLRAAFQIDLAQLVRSQGVEQQDRGLMDIAEGYLIKGIRYAPYNSNNLQQAASHYVSLGQFDQAFEYVERAVASAPLRVSSYDMKSNAYQTVGNYFIEQGERAQGLQMYEKAMEVVEDIKRANGEAEETIRLTNDTMDSVFRVRHYLENQDNPEKLSQIRDIVYLSYLDLDVDGDGFPDRWRIWNRVGGNIQADTSEEGTLISNSGDDYGMLRSPTFELYPSTTYEIEIKAIGDVSDDHIRLLVRSANGTGTQFSQRALGETTESNTYSFVFTTTDDIEPGGQEIRFYHYGDSDKSYIVEKVVVYEVD
ncbi:MAG: O-antigen ligase family protein [Clostridiaceae bacterium]|nr:O-antigen ligase family protein [Clostridiaceae bacterium]